METKPRILYLKKILEERTDEEHPLSTTQLINILNDEYGISAHRTTVTKDIAALQEFGMDIVTIHSTQSKYFVASRKFELPELKLLIDAVESSKFITKKKSETLIEKIHTMTSPGQVAKLKRNNYVVNRIKPDNEQIYYIIDAINDAINAGKQISFQYYDYTGLKKKVLKNKGEVYKLSPYKLLWCGDYYYVLGYSEKKSKVINFRVDRIASKPEILDKDIFDFVQRVNLSACNRKNIENLALAGAFDSFTGIKREDFFVKNAKDETFTEVLVRYGNKYQMDKAAAANSLFGGENQVDIATPEIIPSPAWGDLERLNKERDLVGIYLSAHPLDEYAVILENVCNVHMAELADLTPLQNRDLTMGGIVSAVREGYTKTGKPYGIAKVEDYSGSAEFAFFGNEWVEKKNFFMTGMFLFMRGKCQPKQWRQEEWEVKISTIELLPEVKEKIIEKLTVSAPLSALDEELITEFSALIKAHPGNAELYFHVMDEDGQMYVNLMSRTMKISVQKEIMTYLKSQPQLSYKIN